jgi:hypothetical protein
MQKRFAVLAVLAISTLLPNLHGQTITPGTPAFCTDRPDDLYCLLPRLFDEANPNPFAPITSAFAAQLTQLPLASPASGIIYAYDPRTGVPKKVGQETYGPVLTERGETLGPHRLFIAFTYQRFTFGSLDGIGLNEIPVVFNVCSVTGQCAPIGTIDSLSLHVNQFAFFGTYGLTSRIDVSMAIPLNNVGESAAGVSCKPCNGPYDFSNPSQPIQYVFQPASASNSKTGIGDLVFRVKGQVLSHDKYKLALGLDFRAPTGNELNFLGSGAFGVRPFVAFSRGGTLSPHVNVGYQWNGDSLLGSNVAGAKDKLPDDFFYSAGVDWAAVSRVTIAVDYLGDYVSDQFRLLRVSTTTSPGVTVPDVAVVKGSFNAAKGAIGVKYNPAKNLLISGNLLLRFDRNGLRSNPVPLVGVSYTF